MMNAKQTGIILSLLWLTGCAAMDPIEKTDTTDTTDATVQMGKKEPTDRGEATRTTKTTTTLIDKKPQIVVPITDETRVLTLARLLERLDRVATLEPDSTKQRIKQMNARSDKLNPTDRYEYALLLSRKGASTKSLNRAISLLDDLQAHVKDKIVQEILLLHRRYFTLQKQYRSERNKTIELEKKIEHLKGLEQDLDKSNTRMQESLNPMPGDVQQP
jgi:hypothetical protein